MTRGLGGQSPANVTYHLAGIDFPAKKEDLVEHARKNGAEDAVMRRIEGMPEQEYQSMADVMKGYGEESRAEGNPRGEEDEGREERGRDPEQRDDESRR